jgi:sugar/nucleoside kinase (ribokinase family)
VARGAAGDTPSGARRVVVVGDAMLDVLVEVRTALAHASDTPSRIATSPGGAGANQAVWLARAGVAVALVAVVGADPVGDAAVATLAAEGVDVRWVGRADRATGTVVALVEPDGQRSMLTDRGANLSLGPRLVDEALAAGAVDHVHVSGYCLLDDATRAAGVGAFSSAARRGATRSADAASAGPLRAMGPARFLDHVRGCEFLFCNLEEGEALSERTGGAAVLEVLAGSIGEVVCTLGGEGALAVGPDGVVHRVDPVERAVTDTVGAGDAFTAAYLAARLGGEGVDAALASAASAAAAAVGSSGARRWRPPYSRE